MTNFEYYKDDILDVIKRGYNACITKMDNVRPCVCTNCNDCIFTTAGNSCSRQLLTYLYEEHIEKPKLTKKERMFCEVVETGWIARDKPGMLYIYHRRKPSKDLAGSGVYWYNSIKGMTMSSADQIDWVGTDIFKFITWDDEEPWAVEDLLKLEVIDE